MRTYQLACLPFAGFTFTACGALSSFADFDATSSSVSVGAGVAPADGNTAVQITVSVRYSETVPAKYVPITLAVSGAPLRLPQALGPQTPMVYS